MAKDTTATARSITVGIDGYNLAMPHGTGVATYAYTLTDVLHRAGRSTLGVFGIDAGKNAKVLEAQFFDKFMRETPQSLAQRRKKAWHRDLIAANPLLHFRAREIPLTDRVIKRPIESRFPQFDRLVSIPQLFDLAHRHFALYGRFVPIRMADAPQIMHWTYPVPIRIVGALNIYTVHDIVPLKLPYTTLDNKPRYRRLIENCIESGHICTVSEASRADLMTEFELPPSSVTNCFQTVQEAEVPTNGDSRDDALIVKNTLGLEPGNYFLHFGAIEPKKNIGRLLEAYLSTGTQTPLVLTGSRGWQSEDELRLISPGSNNTVERQRRIAERIIKLEHLPRDLLWRVIANAKAVLFPSLYEGFGLPVLEAMLCGTPVLTSRTSSMMEVGGGAAIYVDPYDTREIAAKISLLDTDSDLRAQLSIAGREQAGFFSPDAYRDRLDRMYGSVLEDGLPAR